MSRDIKMPSWEAKCPCCGEELEVMWQIACGREGGETAQFIGLKPKHIAFLTKTKPNIRTRFVQILNPKSHKYTKIDRDKGTIVGHKSDSKPYKNILIIRR